MATLMERIRNEKYGPRRRSRVLTFEAPGGGRKKMVLPKMTFNRSKKKSQKNSKGGREKISSITMVRNSEKEEMQRVVFNVALNRGEPKNWPGMEEKEGDDSSDLDKLFSTYWGDNDHLLKKENSSKTSNKRLAKGSPNKSSHLKTPKKKKKSSLGSRRARKIMDNVKSRGQTKKDSTIDRRRKLPAKTKLPMSPPSAIKTPEKSPFKVSLLDCSLQLEQSTLQTFCKMDILKIKFKATEAVFRFYQGRGHLGVTYLDLKKAVERTSKKQFTTEDIGRFLRLVPDLYEVKWVQKRQTDAYDENKKKFEYELSIMPKNHIARSSGDNSPQFMKQGQGLARANLFTDRLEAYTNAAHRKWCREQGVKPPLGRYHLDFKPEDVEVKPRAIPAKPQRTELSAREALLKHCGRTKMACSKTQQKLAKLSTAERSGLSKIVRDSIARYNSKQTEPVQNEEDKAILDMSKIPESLRSLPRKTLLKLQGKSKARKILKVDKAMQSKKKILEQLPELVRIIKVFFRCNKRTAMPYRVFVMKMAAKLKSKPSPRKMQEMVDQLCKIVPEFCETISGVLKVFKLKKCDSSKIFRKITKAIQKIEL